MVQEREDANLAFSRTDLSLLEFVFITRMGSRLEWRLRLIDCVSLQENPILNTNSDYFNAPPSVSSVFNCIDKPSIFLVNQLGGLYKLATNRLDNLQGGYSWDVSYGGVGGGGGGGGGMVDRLARGKNPERNPKCGHSAVGRNSASSGRRDVYYLEKPARPSPGCYVVTSTVDRTYGEDTSP